jgi:hypothetical protein
VCSGSRPGSTAAAGGRGEFTGAACACGAAMSRAPAFPSGAGRGVLNRGCGAGRSAPPAGRSAPTVALRAGEAAFRAGTGLEKFPARGVAATGGRP